MKFARSNVLRSQPHAVLVVFFFSVLAALALDIPQYNSRTWQVEDGLPQNIVQAIVQTRDGYLWVGTQKGLARFDGARFTVFNKTTTPKLTGQFITSLCESADGSLWIGSTDGGLMRFAEGQFFSYGANEGLSTNYVKVLCETPDGVLWIGTVSGLSRLRNGRIENFPPQGPWNYNAVRALAKDEDGSLWVGTDRGLVHVVGDNFTFCRDKNGSVPNNTVRAIYPDGPGNVWLGTLSFGLLSFNTQTSEGTLISTSEGLLDNMVTVIYRDHRTNLWIGTYAGLCRYRNGEFITELNPERMSYNTVNALYEDRERNLWVGTKDGLHQLTPRYFKTFTEADGLTRNNVISVKEARDGTLWIGTWGGGINLLKNGIFSSIAPSDPDNRHVCKLVLSLCEGRSGKFFIGTDYAGGFFQFMDGSFVRYGLREGLFDRPVRVIHEDRNGDLWLGTTTGLDYFKEGAFIRYNKARGLAGDTVRVIYEEEDGTLWVGTNEGLSRLRDGIIQNFTTKEGLSHNTVVAIHKDESSLWFGTVGGGINRWREGKFTAYTTRQGMFNDDVFEILEDDFGNFWMTCRYGISRVNKKDFDALDQGGLRRLRSVSYGRPDGIISTECNSVGKPGAWKTKDGRLWFGTAKGLAMVDSSSRFELNNVVPPVVIEKIVADKQPISNLEISGPGTLAKNVKATSPAAVTVPPGRGELEFHYTALSFQEPQKNRFKYQLEGVDADWVDAGSRRVAYYNNIPPGQYRFHVIACNNDGFWNETGAAIAVVLQPHFWQTWWFSLSSVMGGIAAVAFVARYVTQRRLRRRVRVLQQQHALDRERARIAKDMHDHLGASLTQLGLLSELARRNADKPESVTAHTQKISDMTREVAKTLDEIVWSVNPRNDTLKRLVAYIVHYTEEFFETASIRCRMDIPTDLPDYSLPADLRHNLFSVIKESLNNIAKHSGASEAWLHLKVENSLLHICIEDNGKGFVPGEVDPTRNGLHNLRKRLEDMHGHCEITSQPGQGTKLRFSVSLAGQTIRHPEGAPTR